MHVSCAMPFAFSWFPPHEQSFYRHGWIRDALIANPNQPNAELARLCDTDRQFVANTRKALERAGMIEKFRERKRKAGGG